MGFKDDVRELGAELDRRVTDLETAVRGLQGGRTANTTPAPAAPVQASTTGVDYGAVAFGLSEIKRKVQGAVSGTSAGNLAREFSGAVEYFADVFAKADPGFDRNAFRRQAGV